MGPARGDGAHRARRPHLAAPLSLLCSGARVVADGRVLDPGWVAVDGDLIAAVGEGAPPAGPRLDLRGRWLLPGFVDLHVHGGGGGSLAGDSPDQHRAAARFHARHGTTSLLATTVSAAPDALARAVAALRGTVGTRTGGARVVGLNLEGPYLSQACRGAHALACIRDPDLEEFAHLAGLAEGTLRVVTLAPELPGAAELAAAVRAAGAVVSLGHSAAGYDVALAAADDGAALVTHLFNGMPPLHHRRPGLVGAALTSPALTCELIADGRHVDPAVVRLAVAAKGPRLIALVSDCLSAAGLPEGEHDLGGTRVTVSDGLARIAGTDTIAGSALTMDRAVRNVVRFAGVDVVAASRMASETPARLLGLPGVTGRIAPGDPADLVVLDEELAVTATMVGGEWVHRRDPVAG